MPLFNRRELVRSGIALSATTLGAGHPLAHAEALLGLPAAAAAAPVSTSRQRLLMDFDWRFMLGNGKDPAKDLGFGRGQDDFSKSGTFGFSKADYDDAKWRSLHLPHDWAIELPFVHDDGLQSHGYKPIGRNYPDTSVGWYRKQFDIGKEELGRRIEIEFDGAFRSALVFVNGYFIGRNDNGYAPFSFDLTDFLVYGGKNAIVVRLDASFGDGWFYEGAGIYRHVWLRKTDAVHLGQWESYVRTEVKGAAAELSLGTVVRNAGKAAASTRVTWKILDAAQKVVATGQSTAQRVGPNGTATHTATAHLANPSLWSLETPTLYTAVVTLEADGKAGDAESVNFGVRTLRFDVDKGFFLNGKSTKIKGTCNHQDHAGVGAALGDRLQMYRLGVLKAMGSNAVRTSHNMPTPEWVEACDRMGMMMMCETRMMSSSAEGLAQLGTMIKRYRNSPSIILWSIGNEEWILQAADQGERVGATMVAFSHELDPTRLCTAAVNEPQGPGVSKALDVEGFNYTLGKIDAYHKEHPKQPMVGSETGSTTGTRGEYQHDTLRNWVRAYDNDHPGWAENAEEWWKFYAERDWLAGGFAWTGFDYRGEPTPYGWPSINSQFGIVDMCGFAKDNFFYYKAWWGAEPVVHLLPHWNWEERLGEPVTVWVYSNLEEVELFLNGKSLSTQKAPPYGHLEWKVQYEPGVLEARGSKGGKVMLTEKRETTGAPRSIKLTAERTEVNADGEDIVILKVEALDDHGRPVPTADATLSFTITGEGKFLGVGNGDPNSQEPDNEPKRSLFNGLAQVLVRTTKTPGDIVVEATSKDWSGNLLTPAKLTVASRKAELRPAV